MEVVEENHPPRMSVGVGKCGIICGGRHNWELLKKVVEEKYPSRLDFGAISAKHLYRVASGGLAIYIIECILNV